MMKGPGMMLHDLALEDRYRFDGKPCYLSGTQSLVRLFQLEQRLRAEQGLNTAAYVTGYPGSPLCTLDQTFARPSKFTDPAISLPPAVNEALEAPAGWGSQEDGTYGEGRMEWVAAACEGK